MTRRGVLAAWMMTWRGFHAQLVIDQSRVGGQADHRTELPVIVSVGESGVSVLTDGRTCWARGVIVEGSVRRGAASPLV